MEQKAKTRSPELRIFIDYDIIDVLLHYPARKRKRIYSHFREMQRLEDLLKANDIADKRGDAHVSVCGNISFSYRLKRAERHIEILRMVENE